jgi:large repetitive protein
MDPAAEGSPVEASTATPPVKTLPTSVHVWLWIFLGALKPGLESGPPAVPQSRFTTTRLVASSPNPSLMGNPVAFTATISATGGGMPTGTVDFVEGRALIGKVHTTAGVATFSTNALKTGEHFITANFAGDATTNYLGSTSPGLTQIVNDPNDTRTRTVLTLVERHPEQRAEQVGFTLKVKVTAIGSTTPVATGNVVLKFMYGFRTALRLDHDGEATFSSVLPAAVLRGYEVEAIYSGGGGFQASASTLTLQ